MDTSQDIIIIYLCSQNVTESSLRGTIASQAVLDTLVPKSRDFNYDRIVIQTKADALLLTNDEYSWFAYQQQIRPNGAWNRGRQFCFTLIKLLENANVISVTSNPIVQRAFQGIEVPPGHDDPFEYASLLEKEANGKYLSEESVHRVYGSTVDLTFLFLLPSFKPDFIVFVTLSPSISKNTPNKSIF